ncbi:hypothetical protein Tco_1220824 [Tanacetum coccineum]
MWNRSTISRTFSVGIKRLLDDFRVTAAQVRVTAAKHELVMLVILMKNMLSNMDQDSVHMVAASKVPMLKPGEYECWRMRIEQYIQMVDYALWETVGLEAAYEMSWKELMKIMTEVYCPRNGIQKMESELWRLTVKGMVPDEEKNIERCILGLPNNIQWNVTSDEPTRFQDTVKLANNLMDQKVCANAARQAENKRRWESNQGNNHVQQPPPKRQNVARAYTARLGEKKAYAETLPFYNKLQHAGPYRSIRRIGLDSLECALRSQSISDSIPNLLDLLYLRIVIFMDTAYVDSMDTPY